MAAYACRVSLTVRLTVRAVRPQAFVIARAIVSIFLTSSRQKNYFKVHAKVHPALTTVWQQV